ncbi:MAG: primosomal protein [Patescibacteria group bacterium]
MAQLLVETNLFEYKKEVSESGKLILSGVIQRADSKNHNGRIYPRDILEKEIRNYQILVNERRALGQLDHTDQSLVELKDVSHLITELRWEGNDVVGKLEILDTPNGKIVKSLIESGVKLGVSSRAVGSIKEQNGASYVQSDLQMICWDIVSDPSTKGAFLFKESIALDKIMLINEGKSEPLFNKEYRVNRILNKLICGCEDYCHI